MTDKTPHPLDQLQADADAWHIIRREQARDPLRKALAGLVRQATTTLFVATLLGVGTWVVWVMSR